MPTILPQSASTREPLSFNNQDVSYRISKLESIPAILTAEYLEVLLGLRSAYNFKHQTEIAFPYLTDTLKKHGVGYIQINGESVILGFEVEDNVPSLNLVDATQLEESITTGLFEDDRNLYALTISLKDYVNTKGEAGPQILMLLKVPVGNVGMNNDFFALLEDYTENLEQRN